MEHLTMAHTMAQNDFDIARSKAFWHRLLSLLVRKPNRLLSFSDLSKYRAITGQRSLGLKTVAVDRIVGSVGRAQDFDRDFLPRNENTQHRWIAIDRAYRAGEYLPPVELYKVGDFYFVVDGNHRISVARAQGQEYIEAQVTEIDVRIKVTSTQEMPRFSTC